MSARSKRRRKQMRAEARGAPARALARKAAQEKSITEFRRLQQALADGTATDDEKAAAEDSRRLSEAWPRGLLTEEHPSWELLARLKAEGRA